MAAATKPLPALVRSKFKSAQEAGDLTFFASQVSILHGSGFSFQIRYSPALANKPKANKPLNSKPIDVFENPKKLLITEWPPAHNLVLNKFAINANHFILATKAWKEQTDLLEEDDLSATFECVKAYREAGEDLFVFFNSGEYSGASQPHRHIQFLPVNSMLHGIAEGEKWSILADQLSEHPNLGMDSLKEFQYQGLMSPDLPFLCFSALIPSSPSPRQLHGLYLSLYQKAFDAVQTVNNNGDSKIVTAPHSSTISYNMAMTSKVMVLCPRRAEGIKVTSVDGNEIGPIALNGTFLGGTLLVKSEEEWLALRDDSSKLNSILRAIGIPSNP